jgi:hypothetical protein
MGENKKNAGKLGGLMENFTEINGVFGEKWRLCSSW